MDKNRLVQQIDNLKADIQNLISNNKTLTDKNDIKALNDDKKTKISKLKKLTEELKKIQKKEKLEVQTQNELRILSRTIDNLEYQSAKTKGKSVAIDNVKKAKELREKTRNKYLEYLEIEKEYIKNDSEKFPGYLFLHSSILKEYGICPFINYKNGQIEETQETVEELRLKWLKETKDEGILYFNLFNDIVNKDKLQKLYNNKIELEQKIESFIKEQFSESQYVFYTKSIEFIKEWFDCQIKTKRIKEKYKNFINTLSTLYNETNLEVHNYLSIKYNLQISINHFNTTSSAVKTNDKTDHFQKILLIDELKSYIEEYTKILELINHNEKYIKNTVNQLKSDLYTFLTESKINGANLSLIPSQSNSKQTKYTQPGKYFKRWVLLSKDEKIERIESFSKYFVLNNVQQHQHQPTEEELLELSNTLFELLKEAHISKRMVYRDFVWNAKSGCIEKVKNLRYDKQDGFIVKFSKFDKNNSKKNKKKNNESNEGNENTNTNTTEPKEVKKKKVSSKTIIDKFTEKVINEEILSFILKNHKNEDENDKNNFLETLKIKLKVKKIPINDKDVIYNKYDEILKIVNLNKSTELHL